MWLLKVEEELKTVTYATPPTMEERREKVKKDSHFLGLCVSELAIQHQEQVPADRQLHAVLRLRLQSALPCGGAPADQTLRMSSLC